ncbi:transcription factor TFIIIB component B'' homolog isoform X2 [Erpetoichthys calabaricus]|uniref:transcription factor TFIIIB component B'' homolog isoform X2 n=1 Tax=Erpetoichthys calabaricus TaxID=27687 RepID=UPI0022342D77|nr:transcription factor TFIIIB component B'' homolog isoform X2 [Erpetoichthys calabaricus]
MIRRSRISVKPNIRPGGRGLPSSQETKTTSDSQLEPPEKESLKEESICEPSTTVSSIPEGEPEGKQSCIEEKDQPSTDIAVGTTSQTEHASVKSCNTSTIQRRKRISALPNLAKPRTAHAASIPATKKELAPQPPSEVLPNSIPSNENSSSLPKCNELKKTNGNTPAKSPGRRASVGKQQVKVPNKRTDTTEVTESLSGTCVIPGNSDETKVVESHKVQSLTSVENAETQVSSFSGESSEKINTALSTVKPQLSSDRERILKARKLREMLKNELRNEKLKLKKKTPVFDACVPLDRTKMTMRDFIYYLPDSNPMQSSLDDEQRVLDKGIGPSLTIEPEKVTLESPEKAAEDDEEELDNEENVQEDQLLVPRVKVAEDGSIIIDEESLTVEVLRTKGPNVVEEKDPIFERGSMTTYSSFRKSSYTKPWSNKETDMFFLAISMVGTDFSMIGQLFPHRPRTEIKNKFKKEERANSWRIDKAFREKKPFDIEFFSQLLEKVCAEDEKMINSKMKSSKIKPAKGKPKAKKNSSKPVKPDSLECNASEEEDGMTAEKENENSLNTKDLEGEGIASSQGAVKKRCVKKRSKSLKESTDIASPEEVKSKEPMNNEQNEQMGSCLEIEDEVLDVMPPLEDFTGEQLLDSIVSETSQKTSKENDKDDVACPSDETLGEKPKRRQRLQKPKPCIASAGRKRAKASLDTQAKSEKPLDLLDVKDNAPEDISTCAPPSSMTVTKQKIKGSKRREDSDSNAEEEDDCGLIDIQEQMLNKPTRSGRIPKLVSRLVHLEDDDQLEDVPPVSPPVLETSPKNKTKGRPVQKSSSDKIRGKTEYLKKKQKPGKVTLVTLRASVQDEEIEDEVDESYMDEEASYSVNSEDVNKIPAFVPVGLRSPAILPVQVEETMEELEIVVNVPEIHCVVEPEQVHQYDVASDESVEKNPEEEGIIPTENHLECEVDVTDCLKPTDSQAGTLTLNDGNTEAAMTLLAMRNPMRQPHSPIVADKTSPGSSEDNVYSVAEDSPQPKNCIPVNAEKQLNEIPMLDTNQAVESSGDSIEENVDDTGKPQTLASATDTCHVVTFQEQGKETCVTDCSRQSYSNNPQFDSCFGSSSGAPLNITVSEEHLVVPTLHLEDNKDQVLVPEKEESVAITNEKTLEESNALHTQSSNHTHHRRSHFPKPKPNLAVASRRLLTRQTKSNVLKVDMGDESTEPQESTESDSVPEVQSDIVGKKASNEVTNVTVTVSTSSEILSKTETKIVNDISETHISEEFHVINQDLSQTRVNNHSDIEALSNRMAVENSCTLLSNSSIDGQLINTDSSDISSMDNAVVESTQVAEGPDEKSIKQPLSSDDVLSRASNDHTPCISEESSDPGTSSRNGSLTRRHRFPKPKPNLCKAGLQRRSKSSQSDLLLDNDEALEDTTPASNSKPLVEMCSPPNKDMKNNSVTLKCDAQEDQSRQCNAVKYLKEEKSLEDLRSQLPDEEKEPLRENILQPCIEETKLVASSNEEEIISASVTQQNEAIPATNGSQQEEQTFILTLFEIPHAELHPYEDDTTTLNTITAEILTPPLCVDVLPCEPAMQHLESSATEVMPTMPECLSNTLRESVCSDLSAQWSETCLKRKFEQETDSMEQCSKKSLLATEQVENEEHHHVVYDKTMESFLSVDTEHILDQEDNQNENEYVNNVLEPVETLNEDIGPTGGEEPRLQSKKKSSEKSRAGRSWIKSKTSKKAEDTVRTSRRLSKSTPHLVMPVTANLKDGADHMPHLDLVPPAEETAQSILVDVSEPTAEDKNSHKNDPCTSKVGNKAADVPSVSATSLVRPGRKPRGFLSFISNKSDSDAASHVKTQRKATLKPVVNTIGGDRKRTSSLLASSSDTDSCTLSPPQAVKVRLSSSDSCTKTQPEGSSLQTSFSPGSVKEDTIHEKESETDEEPTKVSQYFFSDIFTEVDEPD